MLALCFKEVCMRSPQSVKTLEQLGRVRLSDSFFMRDFLYSEISQIERIPNIPEYPDIAIEAGRGLCQEVLEPIQGALGRISVSVHSKTSCHPSKFHPTVTSHFPTRGYPYEEASHPGTVASLG
jgi:hypothetical protein